MTKLFMVIGALVVTTGGGAIVGDGGAIVGFVGGCILSFYLIKS